MKKSTFPQCVFSTEKYSVIHGRNPMDALRFLLRISLPSWRLFCFQIRIGKNTCRSLQSGLRQIFPLKTMGRAVLCGVFTCILCVGIRMKFMSCEHTLKLFSLLLKKLSSLLKWMAYPQYRTII